MLSSWNQSLTISCVSYVSAAASDYQRVRRILQTYAYTYMFRGRILRTPRIRTCVDRGLVSAYFCCMRILHCTCIWDTAYSFFAVYVSVCGYRLYPCVRQAALGGWDRTHGLAVGAFKQSCTNDSHNEPDCVHR